MGARWIQFRLGLRRFPIVHAVLKFLKRSLAGLRTGTVQILRFLMPRMARIGPMHQSYSAYEILSSAEGRMEGRIAVRDQGRPSIPEPSIMILCRREQHLEQPWPVFWSRHREARLIGSSLAHLNERSDVCIESVYGHARLPDDPAYVYPALGRPTRLDGPWTSVVSRWVPVDGVQPFAHWLLEALPRLMFLGEFPNETRIIVPPHRLRYQVESLELLGLWERCRPTRERHLMVEDYYFSAPGSMIACYNPVSIEYLRATFLPRLMPPPRATPARFFVRRTGTMRNMVNELEVLQFFDRAGWAIVDLATLSFADQVRLFAGAEAVCGIHGSGFAHAVWCRPGCKVVELFAESYLAGDQEWICQCVGADYHFMIFPSDHRFSAHIDLAGVSKKLGSLDLL